jgi:phage-related holin
MEKIKVLIIAAWSMIMSCLGILAIPVLLLVTCNVIDYGTGLVASKYRNQELDSYKGIKKSACGFLLRLELS